MDDARHELIRGFITAVVEDPSRAEHLLRQDQSLVNARWMHDETVLHFLAIERFADAVRFLITHGADVNTVNEFGDSALVDVAAVSTNEIARMLLTAGADPNGPATPFRYCPLHNAARKGNAELVRLLLEAGANPVCASMSLVKPQCGFEKRRQLSSSISVCPSDCQKSLMSVTERLNDASY